MSLYDSTIEDENTVFIGKNAHECWKFKSCFFVVTSVRGRLKGMKQLFYVQNTLFKVQSVTKIQTLLKY